MRRFNLCAGATSIVLLGVVACGGSPSTSGPTPTATVQGSVSPTALQLDNARAVAIGANGQAFWSYVDAVGGFTLSLPVGHSYRLLIANATASGEQRVVGHVVVHPSAGATRWVGINHPGTLDLGALNVALGASGTSTQAHSHGGDDGDAGEANDDGQDGGEANDDDHDGGHGNDATEDGGHGGAGHGGGADDGQEDGGHGNGNDALEDGGGGGGGGGHGNDDGDGGKGKGGGFGCHEDDNEGNEVCVGSSNDGPGDNELDPQTDPGNGAQDNDKTPHQKGGSDGQPCASDGGVVANPPTGGGAPGASCAVNADCASGSMCVASSCVVTP